jgi:Ni,Fe-hydrogenase I cytochrome b subunit
MALAEYRVGDRTQRIFHWVNFLAVLTLALIGTFTGRKIHDGEPTDFPERNR